MAKKTKTKKAKSCGLRWKFYEGTRVDGVKVQADLSVAGDYVISHRHENYNVSFRPPGTHQHVGAFKTLALAKKAASVDCKTR